MIENSFEAIVKRIEGFATSHKFIKRFGADFEEQLDNFTNEENTFSILWVNMPTITNLENVTRYTFDVIVLDQITEGRENVLHIVSDAFLILTDLTVFLAQTYEDESSIDLFGEPTGTAINNSALDGLAGARNTFIAEIPNTGKCYIPID